MDYSKAIRQITDRRRAALDRAATLRQTLIDTDAAFYENEKALRLAQMEIARGRAVNTVGLERERAKILKKYSLTKSDLCPSPSCKLCGDTGFSDGKICRCALSLALADKSTSGLKLRMLSDFDTGVYSERTRTQAETILKKLTRYAESFPSENTQNLILLGGPGNGKTFCASAVAGEVMSRGYSVATMTAFGFVDAMRAYHTTFDDTKESLLAPVLDCDLLVIDDLGTESILKNITLEYLYLVLNERMQSGKHTLFTTNLSPSDIAARYGERTASRMFDKRIAYALTFPDEDLRNALKRKNG